MTKRAKFRVGQVVCYKTRGTYVKIISEPDFDRHYLIEGHLDTWGHESEFRALTKRERG